MSQLTLRAAGSTARLFQGIFAAHQARGRILCAYCIVDSFLSQLGHKNQMKAWVPCTIVSFTTAIICLRMHSCGHVSISWQLTFSFFSNISYLKIAINQ